MPEFRVLPAGDTALVVEFGDHVDRRLSTWVLALARRLDGARVNGVVETVPTIRSLIVHYDPLLLSAASLKEHIAELMRGLHVTGETVRHWQLPVCYDREIAPDLDSVAERAGLVAGASGRTAHRDRLSRLHARVPARHGLSGRFAAGAVGIPAYADAADESAGRFARHRQHADLHLSGRYAGRMASHRTLASAVLPSPPRSHDVAAARRQSDVHAGLDARIRRR